MVMRNQQVRQCPTLLFKFIQSCLGIARINAGRLAGFGIVHQHTVVIATVRELNTLEFCHASLSIFQRTISRLRKFGHFVVDARSCRYHATSLGKHCLHVKGLHDAARLFNK